MRIKKRLSKTVRKSILTSDKAFDFYCNVEQLSRERRRREEESEGGKEITEKRENSEEIVLLFLSSLQVCFPLLLFSWMSAIRHAQLDSCQMCGLALGLLPTGD